MLGHLREDELKEFAEDLRRKLTIAAEFTPATPYPDGGLCKITIGRVDFFFAVTDGKVTGYDGAGTALV